MLDKSVPYASLYMHRKPGAPIPEFPLPPGFSFVMFREGDEQDWARLETSVGEFENEFAALMHFKERYIPHTDELRRRLVFIETEAGKKVATANAWWSHIPELRRMRFPWKKNETGAPVSGRRRAWIHWVSVDPAYQGNGLGKAVTSQAMKIMLELEGDADMYLCTQTWSYKAIDIYIKCGFRPTDEKALYAFNGKKRSECKKALKILERIKSQGAGSRE